MYIINGAFLILFGGLFLVSQPRHPYSNSSLTYQIVGDSCQAARLAHSQVFQGSLYLRGFAPFIHLAQPREFVDLIYQHRRWSFKGPILGRLHALLCG